MAALSEDLTSLTWTDREWLAHFPLIHTANASTVLEYFSRSPFYDRSCLNEQYKMQRLELTAFEKVSWSREWGGWGKNRAVFCALSWGQKLSWSDLLSFVSDWSRFSFDGVSERCLEWLMRSRRR